MSILMESSCSPNGPSHVEMMLKKKNSTLTTGFSANADDSGSLICSKWLSDNCSGEQDGADVDLLRMPGLVSLASPLYDSYISISPTDSRMTGLSSSDYISTANSSRTQVEDTIDKPVIGRHTTQKANEVMRPETGAKVTPFDCPDETVIGAVISMDTQEIDIAASSSTMASPYQIVDEEDFAESQSLAELWDTPEVMNCDSVSILHGSEGLASILADLPIDNKDVHGSTSCIGAESLTNDLEYLMMPGKAITEVCRSPASLMDSHPSFHFRIGKELQQPFAMVASAHCRAGQTSLQGSLDVGLMAPKLVPSFESGKLFDSSKLSGNGSQREACSQGSSTLSQTDPYISTFHAAESESTNGARSNICTSGMSSHIGPAELHRFPMPHAHMFLGKKRLSNSFDHIPSSILPMSAPSSCTMMDSDPMIQQKLACQPFSLHQQKADKHDEAEMGYSSAAQAFSAMLYRARGGGTGQNRVTWAPSCLNDDRSPIRVPPSKARRRHGTAMDPQSIAARTRREKFSDRIRILQTLVPNGERLDTVSMLGQTLEYVRFLQHQVWQLYHGMDPASNIKCEKWKEFLESTQSAEPAT
ncbi:hypothetical protein KP509_33G027600 [Ceratopteris richardii]|uniref:BHLH domain-containing protein n=1 Tax=Ceratopteris richardii TaxID=49495 RepID=A0A8T2QQ06_CERRI|nr:hypothetical protein KP509_33G027600 [Ceratopteris richardii]